MKHFMIRYKFANGTTEAWHGEIARFIAALDGSPPTEAVVYCGSGVTACHDVLAFAHAGLPLPRLYAGSWSEWITDPARPVAKG